jgi:hypothetical protein
MLMKLLISIIMKISSKTKNNVFLSMLFFTAITIGTVLMFLYLSGDKITYIYNQF